MNEIWLCDKFLDPLADVLEQFMDVSPGEDGMGDRLAKMLARALEDPRFEQGRVRLQDRYPAGEAELVRRVRPLLGEVRGWAAKWDRRTGDDEQHLQGVYWEDIYTPMEDAAVYLRNLSWKIRVETTGNETEANRQEIDRVAEDLREMPAKVKTIWDAVAKTASGDKLTKERNTLIFRAERWAGRLVLRAMERGALVKDEKFERLRQLYERDPGSFFRQAVSEAPRQLGSMIVTHKPDPVGLPRIEMGAPKLADALRARPGNGQRRTPAATVTTANATAWQASIDALRDIAQQFRDANQKYPEMYRLTLRGPVARWHQVRYYLIDAITQGKPYEGGKWDKGPFWYFYGKDFEAGLPLFSTLSKSVITLATEGLNLTGNLFSNPVPGTDDGFGWMTRDPFYGGVMPLIDDWADDDHADNWVNWMEFLGKEMGFPLLRPKEGPVNLEDPFADAYPTGVPKPGMAFLPDGTNLNRYSPGRTPNSPPVEDPNFQHVVDGTKSGELGTVTIFDHSLFLAASRAIELLITRATDWMRPEVPSDPLALGTAAIAELDTMLDATQQATAAYGVFRQEARSRPTKDRKDVVPTQEEMESWEARSAELLPYRRAVTDALKPLWRAQHRFAAFVPFLTTALRRAGRDTIAVERWQHEPAGARDAVAAWHKSIKNPPGEGGKEPGETPKKRGRPRGASHDADLDRRISQAMEVSGSRTTVARDFEITVEEVKAAQDRHRKRAEK